MGERPEDVPAILRVLERDVNGWHDLPQADYEAALMEYHALVAERDDQRTDSEMWQGEFHKANLALAAERVRAERAEAERDRLAGLLDRLMADGCETGMVYCADEGCFWCGESVTGYGRERHISHTPDCAWVAALRATQGGTARPNPEGSSDG